ncbi:hypothetical protein N7456_004257 [Penicillium angulare]|uniref:C2H2-type domain-containing protein n=1 Tax=Penicillium angulare TaxID=116970 RepID=A0A9W9KJH5_9EURO|nr:hypothetical protein N7456_004257 [Penicillium angulare]
MSFVFGGHVEKHDNRYWCRLCAKWFGNEEKILRHCANTDKHEWCPTCQRVFVTKGSLLQHQEDSLVHNICFFCPGQPDFSDDDELQIHLEDDHHYCFDCHNVFDTEQLLSAHNITEHNGCPICGRAFKSSLAQESLVLLYFLNIQHIRCHLPRDLKYPYCERDFVRFSSYVRHLEVGPCGSENHIYKLAFEIPSGYDKFFNAQNNWFCNICFREFDYLSGLFSHAEDSHGPCKDLLGPAGWLTALKDHLKAAL